MTILQRGLLWEYAGSWVAWSSQTEETAGNVGQCSHLCREAEKAACLLCGGGVMRGIENRAREGTPESCTRYASGLLKQLITPKCQTHCKTQRLGHSKSIHIWVKGLESKREKEDGSTWESQGMLPFFTHQDFSYLLKKNIFPCCWAWEVRGRSWCQGLWQTVIGHTSISYLSRPHIVTFPFSPTFSWKRMFSLLSGKGKVRSQWFIVLSPINSVYIIIVVWAKAIKSFIESVINCRLFRHQVLEGEACKFSFFVRSYQIKLGLT